MDGGGQERTEALDGLTAGFLRYPCGAPQTMTAAAEAEDAPAATDALWETGNTRPYRYSGGLKKIKMTGRTASAVRPVF